MCPVVGLVFAMCIQGQLTDPVECRNKSHCHRSVLMELGRSTLIQNLSTPELGCGTFGAVEFLGLRKVVLEEVLWFNPSR